MGSRGKSPERNGITEVAAAVAHPLRFKILHSMNSPRRRLSPNQYHLASGHPLGNCAYHFRALETAGCIELVDTKTRRGAVEHYYEPVKRAVAWTREWENLPPVLRENIAASIMSGFVENIGNAIDAGCYADRDPHIAWNAFYTDEEGCKALMKIWLNALHESLALEEEVTKRLEEDPDLPRQLVTYGSAAYPSAPRPELPAPDDDG